MLFFAIYLSISIAAVFCLLRFPTALDSGMSSACKRPTATTDRISIGRARHRNRVRGADPAITLVYSRSRLAVRACPVVSGACASRAKNCQA